MIQKAVQAGKDFITNVVSFIQQLPGKVWSFLSNTISNAASFVGSFANQAIQAGRNFFNGIVNKVREIPGQMISIGSDIVNGIRSGISGAWGALTGWLSSMARGLIDGAANMDSLTSRLALEGNPGGFGLGTGSTTVYNVEQTINSAKALTPSEIATETQNMMRRLEWV